MIEQLRGDSPGVLTKKENPLISSFFSPAALLLILSYLLQISEIK